MAKIVFSARSNIVWRDDDAFDPYYEGFITELKNNGHDLLIIRTNFIIDQNNECVHGKIHKIIQEKIDNFKPDLIFTANNSLPRCMYKHTDCPIVLLMADSVAFLEGLENIKQNVERYFFLHFGWESDFYEDCLKLFNSKPMQNFEVGYHTAIQALDCEKKYNISFVGILGWGGGLESDFLKIENNEDLSDFLKHFEQCKNEKQKKADFLQVLTSNIRIKTLDALTDLGLTIFGWKKNIAIAFPYSLNVVKCFNFDYVTTLAETEQMMNASIISLTLPNAQTTRGLSWRVADTLASNACLISPPKEDLKFISPYVDIPTFTSPLEARGLCKKLLKDKIWRNEIITGAQKAIEEKHRFPHLMKTIEEHINIPMLNVANPEIAIYNHIGESTIPSKLILKS